MNKAGRSLRKKLKALTIVERPSKVLVVPPSLSPRNEQSTSTDGCELDLLRRQASLAGQPLGVQQSTSDEDQKQTNAAGTASEDVATSTRLKVGAGGADLTLATLETDQLRQALEQARERIRQGEAKYEKLRKRCQELATVGLAKSFLG